MHLRYANSPNCLAGWFSASDWEWLNKRVASRFQALLSFHAPPDGDAGSAQRDFQAPNKQALQPSLTDLNPSAVAQTPAEVSADDAGQLAGMQAEEPSAQAPTVANAFSGLTINGAYLPFGLLASTKGVKILSTPM